MKKLISKNLFIAIAVLAFIFTACNNSNKPGPEEHKMTHEDSVKKAHTDSVETVIKKADRSYNDIANFMAGIDSDTSSVLKNLMKTEDFKQHKAFMDKAWHKLDSVQLQPMVKWASTELKSANESGRDLWYPFSGPDFLNARLLFPKAKNYYFVALEPIGEVVDVKSMNDARLKNYYNSIHKALSDIFERSYFITSFMGKQMIDVKGIIPVVFVFMAKTNCTVLSVKDVMINKQGVLEDYKSSTLKDTTKGTIKGVRIDFIANEDKSEIRSFYYFQTNVCDGPYPPYKGLKEFPEFTTYVHSLGRMNTYLKAASYCMHADDFSIIRDLTLSISDALFQDDTGISFRYFNKDEWKVQLYGKYERPIKNFPWIKEPDLEAAYKKDSLVKPLPFHLGYHVQTKVDNEMLFTRIKK